MGGIGLLPGSLTVHLDGEAERLPIYTRAVGTGALAPGYAAEDCAALVFRGTELAECVASRPGARVLRVQADGVGGTLNRTLPVRLLPHAASRARDVALTESHGVSELRALRAGRHRWD